MEDEIRDPLMSQNKHSTNFTKETSSFGIELKSLTLCLSWVCVDQSNLWKTGLSWSVFFLLAIGVPIISHFLLLCSDCDSNHKRPYDGVVQLSLSVMAAISFLCLSSWCRKYGIRRFLFLDKLDYESDKIRAGYNQLLKNSMTLLCIFVLPCFALESAYRIWWYVTGGDEIPYLWNMYVSYTVCCVLQLCSWVYRISMFIIVCILYQLICYLQILRLEEFGQVFQKEGDVASILKEHLGIRRKLRIISHRFRKFILSSLILVTVFQFMSLLMTMRSSANNNIFEAGELALCCINLVTGLFICLRSATKITHKAQSITSLAAKWHVCATLNSYDDMDGETPPTETASSGFEPVNIDWVLDEEEEDIEDHFDNTKMIPVFAHTISFQKRQALVTYLAHNRAGMTVYGFVMDRTWLDGVFAIELALLLWLLDKTIENMYQST